jgi:hypothetical protein
MAVSCCSLGKRNLAEIQSVPRDCLNGDARRHGFEQVTDTHSLAQSIRTQVNGCDEFTARACQIDPVTNANPIIGVGVIAQLPDDIVLLEDAGSASTESTAPHRAELADLQIAAGAPLVTRDQSASASQQAPLTARTFSATSAATPSSRSAAENQVRPLCPAAPRPSHGTVAGAAGSRPHFADLNLTRRIVRAAGVSPAAVIEIGPGRRFDARPRKRCQRVIAVESTIGPYALEGFARISRSFGDCTGMR